MIQVITTTRSPSFTKSISLALAGINSHGGSLKSSIRGLLKCAASPQPVTNGSTGGPVASTTSGGSFIRQLIPFRSALSCHPSLALAINLTKTLSPRSPATAATYRDAKVSEPSETLIMFVPLISSTSSGSVNTWRQPTARVRTVTLSPAFSAYFANLEARIPADPPNGAKL